MRAVRLSSEGWCHEPVMRPEGFLERLRGLRLLEPGGAILIETSSVHSIGIKQSFHALGLSDDYVVMDVATMHPWSAIRFRGCRYVLELPFELDPPAVGTRLEVNHV